MWSTLFATLFDVILPVCSFAGATSVLLYLALMFRRPNRPSGSLTMVFAFALLGSAIGLFTGASKTPVMGTVLPAVLTFLTALWGYLFGKEALSEWRPVIPVCVIALTITMMGGGFLGTGIVRAAAELSRADEEWLLHYRKVQLPVARAAHLRRLDDPAFNSAPFDGYLQRQQLSKPMEKAKPSSFAINPMHPFPRIVPLWKAEEEKGNS